MFREAAEMNRLMTDIVQNPFVIEPGAVQQGEKRVRAFSSGELVPDSRSPLLVWEHPHFPGYFFAASDLKVKLRPNGRGPRSKALGVSEVFDVLVGGRVVPRAAQRYPEAMVEDLRGAYALTWSAFDVDGGGRGGLHPPTQPVRAHRRPRQQPARHDPAQ